MVVGIQLLSHICGMVGKLSIREPGEMWSRSPPRLHPTALFASCPPEPIGGRESSAPFRMAAHSLFGATTRVDQSSGIQASLAGRYALALFELARDDKQLDAVAGSLATLKQALSESEDLRTLIASPLVGREEQGRAAAAVAESLKLDPLTRNFVGVLAGNRRLSKLPDVIRAFNLLAANHRGEITAEVTSARPLDEGQVDAIKQNLRTRMGRDIAVDLSVDPDILGGLVVKIGSQMIDSSIRTKLNSLAHAMKG
jgi:F-type H+-transporting ATPase subunit delta